MLALRGLLDIIHKIVIITLKIVISSLHRLILQYLQFKVFLVLLSKCCLRQCALSHRKYYGLVRSCEHPGLRLCSCHMVPGVLV
jgi:hypothetical protein